MRFMVIVLKKVWVKVRITRRVKKRAEEELWFQWFGLCVSLCVTWVTPSNIFRRSLTDFFCFVKQIIKISKLDDFYNYNLLISLYFNLSNSILIQKGLL